MRIQRNFLVAIAVSSSLCGVASAYVRSVESISNKSPLIRLDGSAIQIYVNDKIAPGLKNKDGQVFITADSTPVASIKQAMLSWQTAPNTSIKFLPLKTTSAGMNTSDNQSVIIFQDTPEIRTAVGGATAVTLNVYTVDDFHIIDNDIIFNPAVTFSTTGAAGTSDLEAVIAHELGHALGANHTNLSGATMYQAFYKNAANSPIGMSPRNLSTDDLAFAAAIYPGPSAALGTIAGTVSIVGGNAAKHPLITAIDVTTGTTIGTLAGPDGKYSIAIPVGSYQVYSEPFNSIVQPANFYITTAVDNAFKATFLGGNASPTTVSVTKGAIVTADIQVSAAATQLAVGYLVFAGPGATGDLSSISNYVGGTTVLSGQSIDIVLAGTGLDAAFLSSGGNVRVLGAGVTVRPGSLRIDPSYPTFAPLLRVTVDIAARAMPTLATIFLYNGSDSLAMSGVLSILPPPPVFSADSVTSSASFATGAVSPGEIVSIFGTSLGPAPGMDVTPVGFDQTTGGFPTTLGGVKVTFNGVIAPAYYVGGGLVNVQVPFEIGGKSVTSAVISFNGVDSKPVSLPVTAFRPAIYTYNGSGTGLGIIVNQDGSLNTASNPAARASVVVIYLTGRGPVNYAIQTGKGAPLPPVIDTGGFTCTIGELSAPVAFGGWTPTAVGLAQANVTVPVGAPAGEQPLVINISGVPSQPGVTIFVK